MSTAAMHLGHHVEVATLEEPRREWSDACGCRVHFVGPARTSYGYAPAFDRWLHAHRSRFDAVIVNGLWQYHGFATWRALRDQPRTPYYVFTHGMLDPWFKHRYPLKHLKKQLYWPWAEYRVLRDARAVLFTCDEERLLARRSFRRYRANEAVVSYGTRPPAGDAAAQREAFLRAHPQLRERRLLLFLGRIHPKKGCDLLIEAFAAVAGANPLLHLVIAGPDQVGEQGALMQLARRLGVANSITWTGMLDGDLKAGALHAAEAFVLPSHQENFGIAVAEALACGVPVLISDKVNIWREVAADDAGLVAPDTRAGTEQLLRRWLSLGGAERAAMSQRAHRSFRNRFHIEAAAARMLEVLARTVT